MLDIPEDDEEAIASGGGPSLASKIKSAASSAAQGLGKSSSSASGGGSNPSPSEVGLQYNRQSFKRGGKVPGHGPRRVTAHGGERILTRKQTKRYDAKRRGSKRA